MTIDELRQKKKGQVPIQSGGIETSPPDTNSTQQLSGIERLRLQKSTPVQDPDANALKIYDKLNPLEKLATGISQAPNRAADVRRKWSDASAVDKFLTGVTDFAWPAIQNFIPEVIRNHQMPTDKGLVVAVGDEISTAAKGITQMAQQYALNVGNVIGGGVLDLTKGLGAPSSIDIPGIGVVDSWEGQYKHFKDLGYPDSEIKALMGINAALILIPFAKGLLKAPGIKGIAARTGKAITKEKIPAEATRKGVKQQIETGKAPEGISSVERPIITSTKEIFNLTKEQQRFNDLASTNKEQFYKERDALLSLEDPLNAALQKLSQKELDIYAEYAQGFKVPNPGMLGELPKNLIEAIKENLKVNDVVEADLLKRGVLTADQIENRRWLPVEIISGRTRAELKAMGVKPLYYPYVADTALSKSDFIAGTTRRTTGSYQKRFTGRMLSQDSYLKDPKIAIPRHRIQVLKDKMSNEFVNDVVDEFAEKNPKMIKAFKETRGLAEYMGVEEWKPSGNLRFFPVKTSAGKMVKAVTKKNVESYWVPKTVAKELNAKFNPSDFEKIMRMTYDPLVDMWRISVLGMMPRWVYNNFMGNFILSSAAGVGPLSYAKAGVVSLSHSRIAKIFGIKPVELAEGVRSKYYAGNEGQTRGFISDKNNTHLNRPIENWLTALEYAKRSPILRVPAAVTQGLIKGWMAIGIPLSKLNTTVENFFRTAVFLAKRDSLFLDNTLKLPKAEADAVGVKYVNEFLNDYSKLNRTERTIYRRMLPFYNWQKFITKFAFSFPFNHPIRAQVASLMLQDYVDFINKNQAEDKEKSILRIKTHYDNEDGTPYYLQVKGSIPFSDIFKTLPISFEAAKVFFTSNPIWKIAMEKMWRINSMTGQPFTAPPGLIQKDKYGNVVNPVPDIPTHIASLFPQVKLMQLMSDAALYGVSLKRYDTGEVKLVNGRLQSTDVMIEAMKYFGVSLSALEVNKMQRQERIDLKVQTKTGEVYVKQLQNRLDKLRAEHEQQQQESIQEQGGFLNTFFKAFQVNLIKQSMGFAKDPLAFYGGVTQSIAQIPANIALAAKGDTGAQIIPDTPLEKFLFGDQPILNPMDQGRQVLAAAGETDPAVINKWGPGLGVMLMASNFIPGGKGIGKVPKVSLRTLDRLESSVTKEVVNRQVVDDLLKQSDVNKFERATIQTVVDEMTKNTAGNINVKDLRARVDTQTLQLNKIESIRPVEFRKIADELSGDPSNPDYEKALKVTTAANKFVRASRWEATQHLPDGTRGDVLPDSYKEYIFESPYTFASPHFIDNSMNYFAHVRSDQIVESGQRITRDLEIQSDLFQKDAMAKEFGQKTPEESNINRVSAEEKALEPYMKFYPERILAERVRTIASDGGGIYRIPDGKTVQVIEKHVGNFNYEEKIAELKQAVKDYGPKDQRVKDLQKLVETYRFYETELPAMLKRGGFDPIKVTDPDGYSWWQSEIPADPNRSVGAYGFLPPVVKNAKLKNNSSAGFTTPGMILAGAAGVIGLDALIMSTYNTSVYERKNPTVKVPDIISTKQDAHGQYFVLEGGADVRPIKDPVFAELYKEFPQIPKGLLEAIYMQESSAGTNDVNAKNHAGEYGWLVGYMKGTLKDIQTRKDDPRVREVYDKTAFDTKDQALRSMAAYLQYRMQNYDAEGTATSTVNDPIKLYFDRYNVSEKGNTKVRDAFSARLNYYASQI